MTGQNFQNTTLEKYSEKSKLTRTDQRRYRWLRQQPMNILQCRYQSVVWSIVLNLMDSRKSSLYWNISRYPQLTCVSLWTQSTDGLIPPASTHLTTTGTKGQHYPHRVSTLAPRYTAKASLPLHNYNKTGTLTITPY